MIISDKLPHTAYKITKTAYSIFLGKAAANLTPLNTPNRDFRQSVTVSGGTNNTGTVTISGTLDGDAKSEVLTFAGTDTIDCTILLDTLTSITTANLADEATIPDVSIVALDYQSVPILSESQTLIKTRFESKVSELRQPSGALSRFEESRAFIEPSVSFAVGDIFRYNSQDYVVRRVLTRSGLGGVAVFKLLYFE